MIDKFKRFLQKPVYIDLNQEMTVVALVDGDYESAGHNRTYTILESMARLGGEKIEVICLHQGNQHDAFYIPTETLNFTVAKLGSDIRPLFRGRVVFWTDSPKYTSTLETAHPNLIVYDDREKGISSEEKRMYELADLVLSYDPDCTNFVPASAEGAAKALRLIQKTPNRKPPRQ